MDNISTYNLSIILSYKCLPKDKTSIAYLGMWDIFLKDIEGIYPFYYRAGDYAIRDNKEDMIEEIAKLTTNSFMTREAYNFAVKNESIQLLNIVERYCKECPPNDILRNAVKTNNPKIILYIVDKYLCKYDRKDTKYKLIVQSSLDYCNDIYIVKVLITFDCTFSKDGLYNLASNPKCLEVLKVAYVMISQIPDDLINYAIDSQNLEIIEYVYNYNLEYIKLEPGEIPEKYVRKDSLRRAINTKNLTIIRWVLEHVSEISHKDVTSATRTGKLEILELIVWKYFQLTDKLLDMQKSMDISIANNYNDITKYIRLNPSYKLVGLIVEKGNYKKLINIYKKYYIKFTDKMLKKSIVNNYIDIAKFIVSKTPTLISLALIYSIKYIVYDLVLYLVNNYPNIKYKLNSFSKALAKSIMFGSKDILMLLYDKRYITKYPKEAMNAAFIIGNVDIIEYIKNRFMNNYILDEPNLLITAAKHNHYNIVNSIYEENSLVFFNISLENYIILVENSNEYILDKFIINNKDESILMAAAKRGNLEIFKYLYSKNYPFNREKIIEILKEKGFIDIMEFIFEKDINWLLSSVKRKFEPVENNISKKFCSSLKPLKTRNIYLPSFR